MSYCFNNCWLCQIVAINVSDFCNNCGLCQIVLTIGGCVRMCQAVGEIEISVRLFKQLLTVSDCQWICVIVRLWTKSCGMCLTVNKIVGCFTLWTQTGSECPVCLPELYLLWTPLKLVWSALTNFDEFIVEIKAWFVVISSWVYTELRVEESPPASRADNSWLLSTGLKHSTDEAC